MLRGCSPQQIWMFFDHCLSGVLVGACGEQVVSLLSGGVAVLENLFELCNHRTPFLVTFLEYHLHILGIIEQIHFDGYSGNACRNNSSF